MQRVGQRHLEPIATGSTIVQQGGGRAADVATNSTTVVEKGKVSN